MGSWLGDLRYAVRVLLLKPAFTAITVATLALGIGANTAIFSVVNGVLLQPLSYPDSERLVYFRWNTQSGTLNAASATKFLFWREHSQAFEEVAAYDIHPSGFNLIGGTEPEHVPGMRVSEGFFRALGVEPALGRSFTPEEGLPGGPQVAVLSHSLWQRNFGGDPDLIGRNLTINNESYTIVGILPAGFQFTPTADVWTPLQVATDPEEKANLYSMIGRLKQGTSPELARTEMDRVFEEFRKEFPALVSEESGGSLNPYRDWLVGDLRPSLLALFGAVGFVLLISCANVANLLLARSSARAGEMAIRVSLGAGRLDLLRQLIFENVLLALAGGTIGMLIAGWCVSALLAMNPEKLPRAGDIRVGIRETFFAFSISLVIGLLLAVVPALRAMRANIKDRLQSSGRPGAGLHRSRIGRVLIVSEIAFSLVLLVTAALLIESFLRLRAVKLGFDPENVLTFKMPLTSERYQTTTSVWDFTQQVLRRIEAVPGVTATATATSLPMETGLNIPIHIEGRSEDEDATVEYRAISPDYFRTLSIPLTRGRGFAPTDAQNSNRVVIINEAMARLYWSDRNPLVDRLWIAKGVGGPIADREREIIGVVSDIRELGLESPPTPTIFVPQSQVPDGLTALINLNFQMAVVVRTTAPDNLLPAIRPLVIDVDPQQPVAKVRLMREVVGGTLARQKFNTVVMTIFAGIATLLTALGIYGVLSYQVSQRAHEIGLRMALGAQQHQVLGLIVGQGMILTAVGIAAGVAMGLALTRFISSLIFGVSVTNPATFALVALLLIVVALLASYIPARRATKGDPMMALRSE